VARKSTLDIPVSQYENKAEYLRQWRKLNPDYDKDRRDPEKTREKAWKRRYGITRADYNRMLQDQHGSCAICKTTEIGRGHSHFHVDHNHATGKVRGLLCDLCNRGLGYFKDSSKLMKAGAIYLEMNDG